MSRKTKQEPLPTLSLVPSQATDIVPFSLGRTPTRLEKKTQKEAALQNLVIQLQEEKGRLAQRAVAQLVVTGQREVRYLVSSIREITETEPLPSDKYQALLVDSAFKAIDRGAGYLAAVEGATAYQITVEAHLSLHPEEDSLSLWEKLRGRRE